MYNLVMNGNPLPILISILVPAQNAVEVILSAKNSGNPSGGRASAQTPLEAFRASPDPL